MRIPDLEGSLNFRDMGGYPGANGRTVKWRTLFRSGTTHAMTEGDLAQLHHLRFACDLRSTRERRAQPTRLTEVPGLSYHSRDHEQIGGDIQRLFESPHVMPEDAHAMMVSLYRELPYDFEDAFRILFAMLSQGDLPLVFNSAAGKDRTGVAAALVLDSLGVPRSVILEDYMLTEQFFERSCELLLNEHYRELFGKVEPAVWEPLMRVHPDYLQAMFDRVEHMHGSVQGYLRNRLGLEGDAIENLRHLLLE